MTTLSTHVLDTGTGLPAGGLAVRLEDSAGATLAVALTDRDGRVADLRPGPRIVGTSSGDGLSTREDSLTTTGAASGGGGLADGAEGDGLPAGVYRLVFDTGSYFGPPALYPEVVITIRVAGQTHLHLPLLLSAYAYTTYRGS